MSKYTIIKPLVLNILDYLFKRPRGLKYIDYFLEQPIGLTCLDYILQRPNAERQIFQKYLPSRLENYLDYFFAQSSIKEGVFQKFIPNHLDKVAELVITLTQMNECYSQEGEDLFLLRIFGTDYKGFYVDVGSHHPRRFSNTYLLYKFGWRGVNIDAAPKSIDDFNSIRPHDINIESAITNDFKPRVFYLFAEAALNTFNEKLAQDYMDMGFALVRREVIIGESLASVLDRHLQAGKTIDVLSVDVEGDEYGVLSSNDWSRYRPNTVLLEILDVPFAAIPETPEASFLIKEGYMIVAKFTNTVVFRLRKKN
jgi:hypothetical protein